MLYELVRSDDVDLTVLMRDGRDGSQHNISQCFTRTCCPSFPRTLAGSLHLLLQAGM